MFAVLKPDSNDSCVKNQYFRTRLSRFRQTRTVITWYCSTLVRALNRRPRVRVLRVCVCVFTRSRDVFESRSFWFREHATRREVP